MKTPIELNFLPAASRSLLYLPPMQYTIEPATEAKISIVTLSEAMDEDHHRPFFNAVKALIDEDHSFIIDCQALSAVNPAGIQALTAVSESTKRFNNVAIFINLPPSIASTLAKANALKSLSQSPSIYQAIHNAKELKLQQKELRTIPFGRKIETPKSTSSPSDNANKQTTSNEHGDNALYRHFEKKAKDASEWDNILEKKLGSPSPSQALPPKPSPKVSQPNPPDQSPESAEPKPRAQTPSTKTTDDTGLSPSQQAQSIKDIRHALEGVTNTEKDALFGDAPLRQGNSSGKKNTQTQKTRQAVSNTRPSSNSGPGFLSPALLSLILVVCVLHFFKDPLYALMFPEDYRIALATMNEQLPPPEQTSLDSRPNLPNSPAGAIASPTAPATPLPPSNASSDIAIQSTVPSSPIEAQAIANSSDLFWLNQNNPFNLISPPLIIQAKPLVDRFRSEHHPGLGPAPEPAPKNNNILKIPIKSTKKITPPTSKDKALQNPVLDDTMLDFNPELE